MNIEAVEEATPRINAALARLLPRLNPKLQVPDISRVGLG